MPAAARYTAVAIVLHWAIAAAIIGNLLLGRWMRSALETGETQARAIAAFQLHKSLGLTILILSLLRLAWRLLHPPPPLPAAMPWWEALAAKATHWAFYALMVAIPLSGWLYVSTQWRGQTPLNVPTLWFGLFEVPHLFGLNEMARELRQAFAGQALEAHVLLVWGMAALLALHIAAALKHHYFNRDEVLANMLPLVRAANQQVEPRDWRRSAVLMGGAAAIAAAVIAMMFALYKTPLATPAAALTSESAVVADIAVQDLPASTTAADATGPPAAVWTVDTAASEINFSGTHAGVAFQGRFKRWTADIRFDPANLAGSTITAIVETGSAADGDPLHEETLPQAEWFDVAHHPNATFRSTAISARGGDHYDLTGRLTIKGRELPVAPLVIKVAGDQLTIEGRVKISRSAANLGMESDPDGTYVSRNIAVEVRVAATRAP